MAVKKYSVKMLPDSSEILERLAFDVGAIAKVGQRQGAGSWRTLLNQIAYGELGIVTPGGDYYTIDRETLNVREGKPIQKNK